MSLVTRFAKPAFLISALCSSAAFQLSVSANNISFEQVKKDISFLADDKLAGRASFTPEIDKAADYISQRFDQIGLKPIPGEKSFKQTFEIYQINSENKALKLNGTQLKPEEFIVLTSHQKLDWENLDKIEVVTITAEQDFRQAMSAVNQKDTNVLVLADPKHQAIFQRYQSFFDRGQTKFKINQGPSAVIALTTETQVNEISFSAKTRTMPKKLTNVAGYLPGKKNNSEVVMYSAHYDHIGTNFKLEDDKIFNGADDDASGTAAVINLAEYFAKKKDNHRSLMFVAFTAEEIGGFGSKYFSKNLNPDKVVAMINIEMIGKPSKFGKGGVWMTGFDRSDLATIMNKQLSSGKVHPDPYPKQNLFYRSDNATLARLGVPAHSFSSSQIDIDPHYHKVSDEVSTLDLKSMHLVIEALAKGSMSLVNGQDTPSRVDTSQVTKTGSFY